MESMTLHVEKQDVGSAIVSNKWTSVFFDNLRRTIPSIPVKIISIKEPTATPKQFYVGSLLDDRLRLRQTIKVRIMQEGDSFIAFCKKFEEYGYGDDPMSAVDDLRQAISELYWTLKEEKGKLGPAMVNLWTLLQSDIEER